RVWHRSSQADFLPIENYSGVVKVRLRTDVRQSFAGGIQALFTPPQEFNHVSAEYDGCQFLRPRFVVCFAQVPLVSPLKIDDMTRIVDGANSGLIVIGKSHEFHRSRPSEETT